MVLKLFLFKIKEYIQNWSKRQLQVKENCIISGFSVVQKARICKTNRTMRIGKSTLPRSMNVHTAQGSVHFNTSVRFLLAIWEHAWNVLLKVLRERRDFKQERLLLLLSSVANADGHFDFVQVSKIETNIVKVM